MRTDLLAFLTHLVVSPCAKTLLPDIDSSANANELCARLLVRAFESGDLGNKECIRWASLLLPSWGWPTHAVSIDARRNNLLRIILFITQSGEDPQCRSVEVTVANRAWGEDLEAFRHVFSGTLSDLGDRFALSHDGNAFSFDERMLIPGQVERLGDVVTVLAKRMMVPLLGPAVLPE